MGGRLWGKLAMPAGLFLMLSLAGPARGQPAPSHATGAAQKEDVPAAGTPVPAALGVPPGGGAAAAEAAGTPAGVGPAKVDPLAPATLMSGPSLYETGRIATAPVPTQTGVSPSDALIGADGHPMTSPKEKSIAPAASTLGSVPVMPSAGVIAPRVLEREIGEHFVDIASCRVEVARARQVTPPMIPADRLLLRWIIQPDGTMGPTEVVAIAPVDLAVMDCAKRVMSQWQFTPPRGGSLPVERYFKF